MKFLMRVLPLALLTPVFAFAAPAAVEANFNYFTKLVTSVQGIISSLIPVMLALGLLFFLWGMFQYFILGADDEGKRETGRSYMIYGLIGLAVMVAVWGLVNLLISIVGIDTTATGKVPQIPGGPTTP